jgi:hypothetical protein
MILVKRLLMVPPKDIFTFLQKSFNFWTTFTHMDNIVWNGIVIIIEVLFCFPILCSNSICPRKWVCGIFAFDEWWITFNMHTIDMYKVWILRAVSILMNIASFLNLSFLYCSNLVVELFVGENLITLFKMVLYIASTFLSTTKDIFVIINFRLQFGWKVIMIPLTF